MDHKKQASKYSNTSSLTLKQLEIIKQVDQIEAITAKAMLDLKKLEKDLQRGLK